MTYIILVYYIFTSDITYLSFAAIARCSIPVEILEKPPAFLSDLLPNFLGVSKWKYSVRAAPHLRDLERHCTVRGPKFAFPVLVDQHFKCEMLMAGHALITKYLSQHFLQRANPEGKVLTAIPVAFSHVVTREMALCYGCCHTLM